MKNTLIKNGLNFLLISLLTTISTFLSADEKKWYKYDHLYLHGGAYTHFINSTDFDGPNLMLGLEAVKSNDWVYGLFMFDNSFGQFSQYAYTGKQWHFSGGLKNFHAKLTAGIIHGYKEPWNNKLPFTTKDGWTPGIIPSIGYKKDKIGVDVMLLGYEGLMFAVGIDL